MASEPTRKQDILTDHMYDGIQEYDNPLPGWWVWLWAASFVFAILYWVYFHMGVDGRSIHDEYDNTVAAYYEEKFEEIGDLKIDQETMVKYMNDPEWLTVGAAVYKINCVSCHGAAGNGLVGPNLTDDHYKNVKKIEDIAKVVQNGAANGAMPAWRNRLNHINKIVLVSAYVAKMRGKNIPGPRPVEGEVIPPWPTE